MSKMGRPDNLPADAPTRLKVSSGTPVRERRSPKDGPGHPFPPVRIGRVVHDVDREFPFPLTVRWRGVLDPTVPGYVRREEGVADLVEELEVLGQLPGTRNRIMLAIPGRAAGLYDFLDVTRYAPRGKSKGH